MGKLGERQTNIEMKIDGQSERQTETKVEHRQWRMEMEKYGEKVEQEELELFIFPGPKWQKIKLLFRGSESLIWMNYFPLPYQIQL